MFKEIATLIFLLIDFCLLYSYTEDENDIVIFILGLSYLGAVVAICTGAPPILTCVALEFFLILTHKDREHVNHENSSDNDDDGTPKPSQEFIDYSIFLMYTIWYFERSKYALTP